VKNQSVLDDLPEYELSACLNCGHVPVDCTFKFDKDGKVERCAKCDPLYFFQPAPGSDL
jgi:transcription elongation factor Elf1